MIHYTDTTVFNVSAQTIVNTVNCVGVMGAGIALEFQLRFPEMEKDYVARCQQKTVELGRPYLYRDYENLWILNFPTKFHWKHPSKLEWIEQGLKYFAENCHKGGITSIAFPKLGCSHGGLEWNVVSPLMEKYLNPLDIDIFICEDTERKASGIEGHMVQMLNDIENSSWSEDMKLRMDIKRKIANALPIDRFRDLRSADGIGKQTYKDVFSFIYSLTNNEFQVTPTKEPEVQYLSLFELDSTSSFEEVLLNYEPQNRVEVTNDSVLISHIEAEKESGNYQDELDSLEVETAFDILLPHIEKYLAVSKEVDEISKRFDMPKQSIKTWLNKAEELGKVKKIKSRPQTYISSMAIK
jgi:O-acetyl-ADP-ribose deacetylase (regulator of RNase III)